MNIKILATMFEELECQGLSETLRHEAQNAIVYRKWGEMDGWHKNKAKILARIKGYQPQFVKSVEKIMNEA